MPRAKPTRTRPASSRYVRLAHALTPADHPQAVDTGSSLVLVADTIAQQFYALVSAPALSPDMLTEASTDPRRTRREHRLRLRCVLPITHNSHSRNAGFYTYPCASTVAPALVLSGRPFAIHADDFNLGRLSEDSPCVPLPPPHNNQKLKKKCSRRGRDCVGGIVGVTPDYGLPANLAIVGDVFLKSCACPRSALAAPRLTSAGYVTFDYAGSRVGLAPSVNNQR